MCPPRKACRSYQPDYEADKGHLCYGFGHTPPCKNCGQDERQHRILEPLDKDIPALFALGKELTDE